MPVSIGASDLIEVFVCGFGNCPHGIIGWVHVGRHDAQHKRPAWNINDAGLATYAAYAAGLRYCLDRRWDRGAKVSLNQPENVEHPRGRRFVDNLSAIEQ